MFTAKYGKADIVKFVHNKENKEGIIFSTDINLIKETEESYARANFIYKIRVYDKFSLKPTFLNIDEDDIIEQL